MSAMNETPTLLASSTTPAGILANGGAYDHSHMLLTPDTLQAEIKNEPPEDINDVVYPIGIEQVHSDHSPKIRLTPTIKLMPVPNPIDPKRKFVCPYDECTKSYGKSSHLRSHLTWHTGIKPFVCSEPTCNKGFTRSDELNRHVRTHTGEKPFECIQCTKKFSRSDHLTKHLATHAKQMQTPSPSAAKRLRASYAHQKDDDDKIVKREVVEQHEQLVYDDGMHFMSALIGKTAERTKQKMDSENLTGDGPLGHSPIKIKLERPNHSQDYHVVSPSHDQLDSDDYDAPMIKAVSTMICPDSPDHNLNRINDDDYDDDGVYDDDDNVGGGIAMTSSTRQQRRHCKINVINAASPTLHCLDDNTTITKIPQAAAATTERYDRERPFACSQCEKSFKRQDDLTRHLRTHTGEKPFACTECDRRFMRSDHLKKHLKTHTRLR